MNRDDIISIWEGMIHKANSFYMRKLTFLGRRKRKYAMRLTLIIKNIKICH